MLVSAIRDCLAAPDGTLGREIAGVSRGELAAAALMVECARVDGGFTDEERHAICRIVRERLHLDAETAACLVAVAERRSDELWHDWLFTETVRQHFDAEARCGVIEILCEVAWADGELHRYETHMIERIAEQIRVPREQVARACERRSPAGAKP